MKHAIPPDQHGATGAAMAAAVETCVHCGFCLPDCPTYRVLGAEADSPRGRIILMKEVLEGDLSAAEAQPHIDRCLGCLACETTCPSGVKYGDLISPYRDFVERDRKRSITDKLRRKFLSTTLPSPKGFRTAVRLAKLARPLRKILPKSLGAPFDLLPKKIAKAEPLASHSKPEGDKVAHVALLAGCAQQVIAPGINTATVSLLTRLGVEVTVPESQVCCGALAWHTGDGDRARAHARQNLEVFPGEIDAIISNAAGCGSALHEYPTILAGEPEQEKAEQFTAKVFDITTFLDTLDIPSPQEASKPLKIAYHDACHLAHAQGVRDAPRRLLKSIPGVELIELPDSNVCCGSAGTYNLDQPQIAAQLGEAKAQLLIDSGADLVASGNIGCLTQLQSHLTKLGADIPIRHTVEILDDAYAGAL